MWEKPSQWNQPLPTNSAASPHQYGSGFRARFHLGRGPWTCPKGLRWIPKLKASDRTGSIIHAFIPFDSHLLHSWVFNVPPLSHEEWWGYVRPQNVRHVLDFKFTPFCRQTQDLTINKNLHKTVESPLPHHLPRGLSWPRIDLRKSGSICRRMVETRSMGFTSAVGFISESTNLWVICDTWSL